MSARTRLFKELKESTRSKEATGIELCPDESNIFQWRALIKGPNDTPYEGGTFELAILVPEQYPLVAPAVRYHTKIFHPNVHWKAIVALMSDPAADSPLNCDAGNLLRGGDVRGYNSMARMFTVEHAMGRGR